MLMTVISVGFEEEKTMLLLLLSSSTGDFDDFKLEDAFGKPVKSSVVVHTNLRA